jgi:hypothetical protein
MDNSEIIDIVVNNEIEDKSECNDKGKDSGNVDDGHYKNQTTDSGVENRHMDNDDISDIANDSSDGNVSISNKLTTRASNGNMNQVDIKMLESLKSQINIIHEIMNDKKILHRNEIDKKYSKFSENNQKTYLNVLDDKVDIVKLEQMYKVYSEMYSKEHCVDKKFEADLKFGEYMAEEFLYKNGVQRPSKKDMDRARAIVRKKRNEPIKGVSDKSEMTRLNFE